MDEQFTYNLKIPLDRIGVLIGPGGNVKKQIEQATHTQLAIDSEEGDVEIRSNSGVHLYEAREIVRAIGRGFNPDVALQLLKQDYLSKGYSKQKILPMKHTLQMGI